MGVKVPNSKSDPQGHSRALAMVPFDRPLPISLPLQLCLHRFRDIVTYFPKFKKVTWLWTHPLGSNISCMHSYSFVSISTQNMIV